MTPRNEKELELPLLEEVSSAPILAAPNKRDFLDTLIFLARHKSFIVYFVGVAAVLSFLISLLLPSYYRGEARIMPPQQSQSMASAMLDQLNGLGGLIGASAAKDLGLKNPSDLFVAMLQSRTVADHLIDRFNLMSLYGKKRRMDARTRLAELSDIRASKEGVISIAVDDRDRQRAADLANAYVEELEKLTKVLAVTDAARRRMFFESQAQAANDELANAEQALKETQERTGIVQLDSQAKVMLEGYAELQAQVAGKEVEVRTMRTFATPENPDLIRKEQELAALRAQVSRYERGSDSNAIGDVALAKVPSKALEYVRKLREVKYREALLQVLLKQYEAARIDEGGEATVIQVLDKALPPEKRSWPLRWVIVLSATILAFLVAIIGVRFREMVETAKGDPHSHAQMQLLESYLFRRHKSGVKWLA